MSLEDLKADLAAGGEKVSSGRFRIDADRALAKLRDFRLVDPHHYVFEVLRAAVASDATAVTVKVDATLAEFHFDGTPLPAPTLKDLLSHALSSSAEGDNLRLRLLAFGVAGAMGLKPKLVRVSSSGAALEVHGDDIRFHPKFASGSGTTVLVEERLGMRALRDALLEPYEVGLIRDGAKHFPVKLLVNGKRVDGTARKNEDRWAERTASEDGATVSLWLPRSPPGTSQIDVDVLGCRVVRRELTLPLVQVMGWARDDRLRRNASGSDIVDDDRGRRLLNLIRSTHRALIADWAAALEKQPPASRELFRKQTIALARTGKLDEVPAPLKAAIDAAPILPGPSGEFVTLGELRKEVSAGRSLKFSRRRQPPGTYAPPAVLMDGYHPENYLLFPAYPKLDIQQEVETRRRAALERSRWEREPVEEPKLGTRFVAKAPLTGNGIRGEVGLLAGRGGATVRILSQGKFLQTGEVPKLAPLRIEGVVDLTQRLRESAWALLPIPLPDEVRQAIETAAIVAVESALAKGGPASDLREHGQDALVVLARSGISQEGVPGALRTAAIFELAGGGETSLDELSRAAELRHTPERWAFPALSGVPVVALNERLRESMRRILPRVRLIPFEEQLRAELDIRDALNRPRQLPQLRNRPYCVVPLKGDGFHGELGIPNEGRPKLELILLREGYQLELTELTSRFGPTVAVVECPGLTPDEAWRHAKRDSTFQAIYSAAQKAEREVIGALVTALQGLSISTLPGAPKRYLTAFIKKELSKKTPEEPDDLQRAVLAARMFPTSLGLRSLLELKEAGEKLGALPWVVSIPATELPSELLILICDREFADLASDAINLKLTDAREEIARHHRRRSFEAQEPRKVAIEGPFPLRVPLEKGAVHGEVAFVPNGQPGCYATVFYRGRVLQERLVASELPLRAALELTSMVLDPGQDLTPDAVAHLVGAVSASEGELVRLAAANPEGTDERALLLHAVRAGLETRLPQALRDMVMQLELFPTTTGTLRSAQQLWSQKRVLYVTQALSGETRSKEPVLLAVTPEIRAALERWRGKTHDFTETLSLELYARSRRERMPRVEKIEAPTEQLARIALKDPGFEGEVGLGREAGALFLFHDRRLLARPSLPNWPPYLIAALEGSELEPTADYSEVVRNNAFKRMLDVVIAAADELGDSLLPRAFANLNTEEQARWRQPIAAFGLWAAGRKAASSSLMALPVLEATDGSPLTLAQVFRANQQQGSVRVASMSGTMMKPSDWVWRPRPGETELVSGKLDLEDATQELRRAAEIRARPKLADLSVPGWSKWREPITGEDIEGEVALDVGGPAGMKLELVQSLRIVESVKVDHAMPAIVRVQSGRLDPNPAWTKVARNGAFREVREAVEEALERLVHRFLSTAEQTPEWHAVALAALGWRLGRAGALGESLPRLPLLRALGGGAVTVGDVLAEKSRTRVVSVALAGLPLAESERLVLEDSPVNREVLEALECPIEDVSADLRRKRDIERARQERRLKSFVVQGVQLVTLDVEEEGYRGQLALPLDPEKGGEIILARGGVSVDTYPEKERRVAGVLSHPELPVENDWNKAILVPALRKLISAKLNALFERLVDQAPQLAPENLEIAAEYVLRYLHHSGVSSAAALDRLKGTGAKLATAQVFRLANGTRVDLRTVADPVLQGRRVAIVAERFARRGSGGELALQLLTRNAPWVRLLGSVLGGGTLVHIDDAAAWEEWTQETDPAEDTPLGRGLVRLRKHARLLRADAFGQLGMDDLSDIRLRPGNGKRPIRYDVARKVALIDPANEDIRRALEESESRPDRLFLIVASIYGAVNRALPEVTDEDEARMTAALLRHLATNPALLSNG